MNTRVLAAFGLCGLISLWGAGCNSTANHSEKGGDTHNHDHDHDHAHHGPHKGHLMEIGKEEYHAEWTHDESGKVTFYILDKSAAKDLPIAADKITIDVKIGENAPVTYDLLAVSPMDGKSAAFEIVDKQLLGAIEALSPGVVATLHVDINGTKFDQRIEEHKH
jgi:hypothetical protein